MAKSLEGPADEKHCQVLKVALGMAPRGRPKHHTQHFFCHWGMSWLSNLAHRILLPGGPKP